MQRQLVDSLLANPSQLWRRGARLTVALYKNLIACPGCKRQLIASPTCQWQVATLEDRLLF